MGEFSKVLSNFPFIAIVGRPNVGKSTFFNRVIGRRQAIVQEESGTTRDRIMTVAEWEGKRFTLVDTGGIEFRSKKSFDPHIKAEVDKAVEAAHTVILMVSGKEGLMPHDDELSQELKRKKKRVVLCVNKVDAADSAQKDLALFYKLGQGTPYPISSTHGLGIGELLNAATKDMSKTKESPQAPALTLSIVGEPNAGKSTLLNAILNEERSIVSEVAGTTRDSVEEVIHFADHYIRIIDTAGIRQKRKIKDASTYFSLSRAKKSIEASDTTFLLFDAHKGIHRDTKTIANYLEKERKPTILVANKWDTVKEVEQARYEADMKKELGFLKTAPLIFISAKTKRNLPALVKAGINLWQRSAHYIETSELNKFLSKMRRRRLPTPAIRLKFLTQTSSIPQEFICFVRRKELIPKNYHTHFEHELVHQFGLEGIPIRLRFKEDKSTHE